MRPYAISKSVIRCIFHKFAIPQFLNFQMYTNAFDKYFFNENNSLTGQQMMESSKTVSMKLCLMHLTAVAVYPFQYLALAGPYSQNSTSSHHHVLFLGQVQGFIVSISLCVSSFDLCVNLSAVNFNIVCCILNTRTFHGSQISLQLQLLE